MRRGGGRWCGGDVGVGWVGGWSRGRDEAGRGGGVSGEGRRGGARGGKRVIKGTCKIPTLNFGTPCSGGRVFSRFQLRGKQGVRRHIMARVWIPAELRGACS